MRLAEIGDVRAAEVLGWRMQQDPLKLYNDVDWPELRRDDNERVFAARMLADLARHPPREAATTCSRRPSRASSTGSTRTTSRSRTPTACASSRRSARTKAIPMLEKWADPKEQLPKEGAQPPFPETWATAQSALRYLGWTKDPPRLADPREAAAPAQQEARRVVGLAHAGRAHDPRHDAARARRRRRPTGSRSGATRARTTTS